MKRINIKKTMLMPACALLMGTLFACSDELDWSGEQRVEEGLPATVTLTVDVQDMGMRSRSIVDDEDARNYCANIWVGMYDQETGKRISSFYNTDVADTQEKVNTRYQLTFAAASTNAAYIVAVSNSDVNAGVDKINDYGGKDAATKTLREMLDDATTWEKFQQICVLRPDAADVNIYANTLTMSGWYTENESEASDVSKMPTVQIAPGSNTLSGAIYLRRIIAYNKFNIVAGDNVNLSLNTWQVCNVPAGCYLFEGTDNIADNAKADVEKSFYNSTLASRQFTATTVDDKEGHSFEFYQVENKRNATAFGGSGDDHVGIDPNAADFYQEREREFKTDDKLNTGVYRSLVSSANAEDMSNNYATYVVINANVDYYIPYSDNPDDLVDATPVDPATYEGKTIHRTAKVDYTIHLGYCENKNADGTASEKTAADFNCRRNTRYTYKVTINGVKNVAVEARKNTEGQPGAEGWVTDETGEFERLDSHYCEFNICLTDAERNRMTYRISSPYDGQYYYYSRAIDKSVTMTSGMNEALYTWIKFYPTSDENTLAEYNGGKGKNSLDEAKGVDGDGLWTFNDMCAPTAKASPYKSDSESDPDNTERWYTVFVDEYVYHFDDKGSSETSWPKYCNQDDRMAEFIMNVDQSSDQESTYTYCKYAFSQKSIQTYYKGSNEGDKAIGVEHFEETYCLNMNWDWQFANNPDYNHINERYYDWVNKCKYDTKNANAQYFYDFTNGRYNQWNYIDGTVNGRTKKKWSDVIQQKVPGHVDADGYTWSGCSHPEANYPVYMPKPGAGKPNSAPSPADNNAYYANSICMNRNRDLNGDNEITPDEVKWYLPTSSDYIQIGICQGELPDPIIRFNELGPTYFSDVWNASSSTDEQYLQRYGTYNYHYITSDVQYFWAEQCVTTGGDPFCGWSSQYTVCNTARCVRNLGTDPSVTPQYGVNEVDNAFTYDENTRIFDQNNFRDEQLRGYAIGGLAPHSVAEVTSHPYKKFQVAKNFCSAKDSYISFGNTLSYPGGASNDYTKTQAWTNSLKQNGICGQYYEMGDKSDKGEWRIPSSGELALMWIEGLTQADNSYFLSASYSYFVSFSLRTYTDNNRLYLGYNNTGDRQVLAMDCLSQSPTRLRCVRDVR